MAKSEEYKPRVIPLNGRLILSEDPVTIGDNFQSLKNLRYTGEGLNTHPQGVGGMTKINTTAPTTYFKVRSAIHFQKQQPTESHILVQAYDTGLSASRILDNKTVPPAQGDFESASLFTDGSGAGNGRFSNAPGGNVAYANGVEACIWGGDEHRVARFVNYDPRETFNQDFTEKVSNTLTDANNVAVLKSISNDIDWETHSSADSNDWYGLAWSPSLELFVAVASAGTVGKRVMTSPDGAAWTTRRSAKADPATWTSRGSGTTNNGWRKIAWSPTLGIFVAVADSGTNRAMSSTDGITWTARSPSDDLNDWQDVAWSPELSIFVAVAYGDRSDGVMTSTNGTSWTGRTPAADNDWNAVAWSPELSLFVAVAGSGVGNRVMTSPNGTTWTIGSSPADNDWFDVIWVVELTLFVSVARTGSFSGNRIMTSPDGINWTLRSSSGDNLWNSLAWSPELSLLVAVSNSGSDERVMTSSDGINWKSRTAASGNWWQDVVWSPEWGYFIAVSSTGTGDRVMTSPDGFVWTARTSAADNDWNGVAWSPELGILAAVGDSGVDNRIMTSKLEDPTWLSVAWSPSLAIFAAVAFTVSGATPGPMTSSDGVTWSLQTTASDRDWRGIIWSPDLALFIAVASSGTGNRVMTSSNGTSWVSRATPADNNWTSADWSPSLSLIVAVGRSGVGNRVMTSPDGINWTIRSSAADNDWRDVAWSPSLSLFVAVASTGSGDRVMTSPNGTTWTSRLSATENKWRSVEWSSDRSIFVAVAYSGTRDRIMTSTNGISWTTETSPADVGWAAIIWSPSLFKFAAVAITGYLQRAMSTLENDKMYFLIGSTRTLKGFKLTMETVNSIAGTTVVEYWNGSAWTAVSGLSDGTASGGVPLAQTGTVSFTSTDSIAKVRPIDSVVLYWYRLSIATGVSTTTAISHATVDGPFQIVKDIWDGSLRSELSFQVFTGSTFNDNTVNVFDDTFDSANTATFASIGGLTSATQYLVMGFSERLLGLSFRMIEDKVNVVGATVATVSYWNGSAWAELTVIDGTSESTSSFGKSGLITWNPPASTSEFKREINKGVTLFFYKISFSKTLSATVDIFHVAGIPAQKEIKGFKFPLFADDRIWLCSETSDEKNAVIVTAANAPDVYNGTDTKRFNFGDEKELTAAAWLYNQIGDNVRSIKIFCKANETWVIEGTTPSTWIKYQLSDKIGCVAPETMATTTLGGNETQQVAIWRSAKGFVLCDGRSLVLLQQDIRQFFDARASKSVNISRAVNEVGSIDHEKMEYHWLFSDGSNTTHNRELVYDILRQRWFEIDRGSGKFLQYMFPVSDADGNNFMYGTIDTGFMERLENGTDFDGTAITHEFHIGDSTYDGVMYETLVRNVKLVNVAKTTTANSATITHYGDTKTTGTELAVYSPKASGKRLADVKKSESLGPHVFHSFKGVMTTNDETVGFEPLVVSVFYKSIRKDLR